MQKPLIFDFLFSCKSKTRYHVKGALSLVLKVSVFGTRKWPIGSNGYTNFGKVVVVVVGEGGGV